MKIFNYNVKDDTGDYKQLYSFMPDRCFRMLIAAPSGGGKTNLLVDMIYRLLFYDKIYLNAKNLQQSKYQHLLETFVPMNKEVGYDIIEVSNDKIIPLSEMPDENQKLVIFDDYLNTGAKNDQEIRNYFTNSRNKNCSCIYLSQSFYNTDKTIRLNSSHYCIFDFPSVNEKRMICKELRVPKNDLTEATNEPYSFLYIDKPRKLKTKNFDYYNSILIIYEFLQRNIKS